MHDSRESAKRRRYRVKDGDADTNEVLNKIDDEYFRSYSFLQCHQTMVADERRTNAYRRAILKSYAKIYKKHVIEVGCGTGILSMFAAQAGADCVYAVEASDVATVAKRVISDNGYSKQIHVSHTAVEDFECPVNQVDVIISEWMGYGLFQEWMLPSVLHARDKWLKPGGLMFPSSVQLLLSLVTETEFVRSRCEYWLDEPQKLYKVNLTSLAEEERKALIGKIVVHEVLPQETISRPSELLSLNLLTLPAAESDSFKCEFRQTAFGSCDVYGFCLWFKAAFPADIELDTSPYLEPTHWYQTVLYVPPFPVELDTVITGNLSFSRHKSCSRLMEIGLNYAINDGMDNHIVFHETLTE